MRIQLLTCAAFLAAFPASGGERALTVDVLPGHTVYHEDKGEAGVVMALSMRPADGQPTQILELCEELRAAAGLAAENGEELHLETIFIVPSAGMTVEGYYFPAGSTSAPGELMAGKAIEKAVLDDITARAGIPSSILYASDVDHQISCEIGDPVWHVLWSDVRPIDDEEPDRVIERAHERFMAAYRSAVEHTGLALARTAPRSPV
jgi:hypothetical protein